MTKLHDIFLQGNKDTNHGQAIQKLIENEKLDINAQDEQGNTLLHTMAMHIIKNYYSPYFHKSNPEGKFINSTGYSGHFYYTNYQGPSFLDDLELLLSLGANPTLKNRSGKTASQLLFTHYTFNLEHLGSYLQMIQNYAPYADEIIAIINYAAFRSSPYFKKQCLSQGYSFYTSPIWNDHTLPTLLDERLLPLDSLEQLVRWTDKNNLSNLASEKTIKSIRERLDNQIKLQNDHPFFINIMSKIAQFYRAHRNIFIRGMLLNNPSYPLFDLIKQLSEYTDIESLLNQNLYEILNQILTDYEENRKICESLAVHDFKPLSNEEMTFIKPICESLRNILEEETHIKALHAWNLHTNFTKPRQFLESKWPLFYNQQSKAVIEELKQRNDYKR